MGRNVTRRVSHHRGTRMQRVVRGAKRLGLILLLVTSAGVVGMLTQRATDMPVEHIAISGDMQHVARAKLEQIISPRIADGFLLTDLGQIAREVKALPWVFDANVRREWPGTIHLQVTEQVPIARWGVSSYINQHGEIFEGKAFASHDDLPLLWSEHSQPEMLIEHFKLLQQLLSAHGLSVAALDEDHLSQVSARLTNGTEVQFGDRDFAKRVRRFVALLDSEYAQAAHSIARIDLRYERGAAVLRKKQAFVVTTVSQQQGGR